MRQVLAVIVALALMLPAALAVDMGIGIGINVSTERFPPLIWMCDHRQVYDDNVEPGRITSADQTMWERTQNYAFEGEQIAWKVLVMDKNGIDKIKDVYVTVGPATSNGNGQSAPTILHKTQRFCGNIPSTPTTWTQNIVLPKFDPALGTLTGAELKLNATLKTNIQLEHLSTLEEHNFTIIVNGTVNVSDSDGPLMQNTLHILKEGTAAVFDGVVDYAGPSGRTFPNITDSVSNTLPVSNLAKYTAAFPGQDFSLTVSAVSDFVLIGPGNYAFIVETDAATEACITYHYDQVIPAPGPDEIPIEANCRLDSIPVESDSIPAESYIARQLSLDPSCNARIDEEQLEEFDATTMAYYECVLTVESPASMHGEYWVTANVVDLDNLLGTMDENEYWFFNPVISLTLSGLPLNFGTVRPDTDAYSNTISVGNGAEASSGVLLDMFVTGTDFTDPHHSGAKCPASNVMRLENLRYYATNGAYSTQNDNAYDPNYPAAGDLVERQKDEEGYMNIEYGSYFSQLLYDNAEIMQGPSQGPYYVGNFLAPGAEMSITFKLSLPMPCNGDFTDGSIYFWGEAI